jgi:hypothetical protein
MNWTSQILKEHSKKQKDKIVKQVGNDPKKFAQLLEVFIKGPYRITQRASWPLSYCIEEHPELLQPHWKQILAFANKPGIHDAVKRNTLRMLQFVRIPKAHQGVAADLCFKLLADVKEPVAIRVFAMSVLANIAKEVPELKNEIIPLIEDQLPYASAAFRSRGKKVLKELKK